MNSLHKNHTTGHKGSVKSPLNGNNLIALIVIAFAVVSIVCNSLVIMKTGGLFPAAQTGFASSASTGIANITIIGSPPTISILDPGRCQVLSSFRQLLANVTDENGDSSIANVSFYYTNNIANGTFTYIGSNYYDGDNLYEYPWNTTEVADGYNYYILVRAYDATGLYSERLSGIIAVVNQDTEPDWTAFKNNMTTNLSELSSWDEVQSLKIGNNEGIINFSNQVLNLNGINLSRYINVSAQRISLDSDELECFDVPAYLHFYNVYMYNPRVYRNGNPCPAPGAEIGGCLIVMNDRRDLTVFVSGFTVYELVESAFINIWDSTDRDKSPGNMTLFKNQNVTFYVNLTSGSEPLNNSHTHCYINFSTSGSNYSEMQYSSALRFYTFLREFDSPGTYDWDIICNSTVEEYMNVYDSDNLTISNRAPRLIQEFPNVVMLEDTTALYINNLRLYFEDPENDVVSYNISRVPNVDVKIVGTSILITPDYNWYGNRTFVVYATDEFGMRNQSNIVRLTVMDVAEPPVQSGGGGGGGGGGGSSSDLEPYDPDKFKESPECRDDWQCSMWGDCLYKWREINLSEFEGNLSQLLIHNINETDGIMIRSCFDSNHCNYWWKKPNETRTCVYQPTCKDKIQNQAEVGVDCGGPCGPCFSCIDGIQNQNETGVDCGGPCEPCATCYDKTRNCHDGLCEQGIDCGGPCQNVCPTEEMPIAIGNDLLTLIIIIVLITITLFTLYIICRPYIVAFLLWLLALFKRKKEEPEKTLADIRDEYLAMLEKLKNKVPKSTVSLITTEMHFIFRHFMMRMEGTNKEMTFEELNLSLKSKKWPGMLKIALSEFMKEAVTMDYGRNLPDKKGVIGRIDRAKNLIVLVVEAIDSEQKKIQPKELSKQKVEHTSHKILSYKNSRIEMPIADLSNTNAKASKDNKEKQLSYVDLLKQAIEARKMLINGNLNGAISIRDSIERSLPILEGGHKQRIEKELISLDRAIMIGKDKLNPSAKKGVSNKKITGSTKGAK